MTHPSLNLILALGLLVAGAAPQEQDTGLRPAPPARDPESIKQSYEEQLLGAWQLVGVTYQNVPQTQAGVAGYMLVLPDYLSIELHVMLRSNLDRGREHPFFQSGMHRWRIAGPTLLETSTLIGNGNVNDLEDWTFEAPGTKRTFRMVLHESSLVLEREGESRMVFKRLPRMPFPGRGLEYENERRKQERAKADGETEGGEEKKPTDETGGG